MPAARKIIRSLRALDQLSAAAAIVIGGLAGAAGGFVLLRGGSVAGAVGFVLVLLSAVPLAFSGRPVAVLPPLRPAAPPEPYTVTDRVDGAPPFAMVEVPDGTFAMGDEYHGPVHEVTVSAYGVGVVPVTQALYEAVIGSDPSHFKGADLPVHRVSWYDAIEFCNRLSERAGLRPCYARDGDDVRWDREADGYRLPTEAEWEYAARAGTTTAYSFGDDPAELGEYAWYVDNAEQRVHPAGEKRPNPWGLHDVHGKVWEWCWDWHGGYPSTPQRDPAGAGVGVGRVLRGGGYWDVAESLRSANRFRYRPSVRGVFIGFRCVRVSRRSLGP